MAQPVLPLGAGRRGYDVDDCRDVDPQVGTLAVFDALAAALRDAGIEVIVDLVPNHTSDTHPWFSTAVAAGPGSPERDRYIFRAGFDPGGAQPPNDWESSFGGPAWERVTEPDGTLGQWYFHLFAREQPDLNWDDASVRAGFETTSGFWSDRGVDGFREDAGRRGARAAKDLSDLSMPWSEVGDPGRPDGSHPLWGPRRRARDLPVPAAVVQHLHPGTYVELVLEPTQTGTRLTLTESGFAQLPDAWLEQAYEGNGFGWTAELGELVEHLDAA